MTGKQKILEVLKKIKQESAINQNPEWVKFKFFPSVVVAGENSLSDNERKRILIKLEKEGVLELHLPDAGDADEEGILSQYTPIEYMMMKRVKSIFIRILPSFHRKYFWGNLISFGGNKWIITNPFWILWQLIKVLLFFIKWFWSKHKITTVVFGIFGIIGTFLIYDWQLARERLRMIFAFLKSFF